MKKYKDKEEIAYVISRFLAVVWNGTLLTLRWLKI